jgi:DNA polymerase I-like protein with 3'-5' exonuclease and polymerase domains
MMAQFLLLHEDRHFVWFNVAFDYWVIAKWLGSDTLLSELVDAGQFHDAMILDQLVRLAQGGKGSKFGESDGIYPRDLGEVGADYGYEVNKADPYRLRFAELLQVPESQWGSEDFGFFHYALKDAIANLTIWDGLVYNAATLHGDNPVTYGLLSEQIQVKATIALAEMSRLGIAVDNQYAKELNQRWLTEIQHLAAHLELLAPGSLSKSRKGVMKLSGKSQLPSLSNKTLQRHLAEIEKEHGLTPEVSPKTNKTSMRAERWSNLELNNPMVDTWLKLADAKKVMQFITPLTSTITVHTRYNLLVRTGRTSASNPNLQQMPREPWFRRVFVPRPGYKFVVADYSVIELRTLAAVMYRMFGRSRLRDVLIAGQDPHANTAAMMLGQTYEDFLALKTSDPSLFKAKRQAAKAINFGVPGGLGAEKLARYAKATYGVDMTVPQAAEFRHQLISEVYPELTDYLSWDVFEALAYNTGVAADKLRSLWYGYEDGVSRVEWETELGRAAERSDWNLWLMEKIVKGETHTKKGSRIADWLVTKVWDFLQAVGPLSTLEDEWRGQINRVLPGDDFHKRLFAIPVTTLTGRVRGKTEYTESKNTPFQGLAADGAKLAMWNLVKAGFRPVAFVHDEFVVEVPEGYGVIDMTELKARQVVQIMRESMEPLLGGIPVEAEYKIADWWEKP